MRVSAAPDFSFSNTQSTIAVLTVLVGAVVVAVAAAMLLHRVALRIGRHSQIVADLAHRGRRPVPADPDSRGATHRPGRHP